MVIGALDLAVKTITNVCNGITDRDTFARQ